MNPAIWKKAFTDAWRQLLVSWGLLVAFSWVFAWLMSRFRPGVFGSLLSLLPDFVQPLIGMPLTKLATPLGQLSILYVHVVTMLVCVGWALGRGSDSISGEIGRGTMDLILALPIWRATVIVAPAVVAALGTAVLVVSVLLGTLLGLLSFDFGEHIPLRAFLPGAVNLFAMIFCFTGITTAISSWNRDRWRAILWSGGLFTVALIVKVVARLWPTGWWLYYCSFLTPFEPQELILVADRQTALRYDGTLLALGLGCYLLAVVVFWWRDIPAAR